MTSAFIKAFAQLGDPKILKYLFGSVLCAVLAFVVLWGGVGGALVYFMPGLMEWMGGLMDWLGWLGVFGGMLLTWLLFPAVLSAFVSLFLDGVASAVEARHYPDLPPAQGQTLAASVLNALRFLAVLAGLNLLILPVLIIPGLNLAFPALFYAVNGYILGREYFEIAAQRRLSRPEAREMRRARRYSVIAAGTVTAFLLTIPVINLIAPVIAASMMVHLFHSWRGGVRLEA
ncbi:MAG: EI24 domain-containing protein [Rhodospirillales bacterium]